MMKTPEIMKGHRHVMKSTSNSVEGFSTVKKGQAKQYGRIHQTLPRGTALKVERVLESRKGSFK